MNRPIGYKVPTFLDSAAEAKAEWMRWVAYVNALEEDKRRLVEALKIGRECIRFKQWKREEDLFDKLIAEMEGAK